MPFIFSFLQIAKTIETLLSGLLFAELLYSFPSSFADVAKLDVRSRLKSCFEEIPFWDRRTDFPLNPHRKTAPTVSYKTSYKM